jgi:SH3-like domain-containing protein
MPLYYGIMNKKSRKKMLEGCRFSAYSFLTMKRIVLTTLIMVCLLGFAGQTRAEENAQPLPVPRYVSLDSDEVNIRTGPGIRYPIKFILKKDKLPVEIIKEFDVWREVRSMEGDQGWVHKSLLSGKRTVIIKGHIQTLLQKPEEGTKPVVKLEPGVIAGLDRCDKEWCYLNVASYEGWMKRADLWGIYPDEKFTK